MTEEKLMTSEDIAANDAIAEGQAMQQMYMAGYLDGYCEAKAKGRFYNKKKLIKDNTFMILVKKAFDYRFNSRIRKMIK